ncbi:MAG TPA: hypothetical protein PLE45_08040 [Spirochaetota bacterium]|nr:hypothetical protein [Spirochaetota bacterium]
MKIEKIINESIEKIGIDELREILSDIIINFCNPAFGALPKKEIEIIFFDALKKIGILKNESEIYEIIEKLHISQTKARSLIYESGLRKFNESELDNLLLKIFKTPSFYKDGNFIYIEIDNPLLIDRLKYIIKIKGGCATDGSFSKSIVKLKEDGFVALVEYFAEKNNINIRSELLKAGIDKSNLSKIGTVLFKLVDSIKDMSFSDIFDNIINMKDIIKDSIKNNQINKLIQKEAK